MCTYIRTVFGCNHGVWGRCTDRCAAGEAYWKDKKSRHPYRARRPDDKSRDPCVARRPDVKLSRVTQRKCEKCRILDGKIVNMRAKMVAIKVTLEKLRLAEEKRQARKRERAMAESEEKDGFGGEDISSATKLVVE
ncbi:hypothetical protein QQZ08_002667 [Neonectria magnoliae]|uniref:Uncharacterized protein n=1 Tax=Neonectria magnoliae TaxID=2732573 RepID=A0ABR1IDJ0_9HYPO